MLILGKTNARARFIPFHIKPADRLSHIYVIGETGVGKSTLLENLVAQDIRAGVGCALIDPHGDLVRNVLAHAEDHSNRILAIDIADPELQHGYNPLARVSEAYRPLVASGLMSVMKKMWADAWGVRMEHILRNTLLALLDQPRAGPQMIAGDSSSSAPAGKPTR